MGVAFCLLVADLAVAMDIIVVAHPDLQLSKAGKRTFNKIFLKKITRSQDQTLLVPVNLPSYHPVRGIFSKELFNLSANATSRYWNEQYFQGVEPPYVLDSQEAVLRFVSETPGSVGYVLDCLVDDRVNPVFRIPIPPSEAGKFEPFCRQP